MIREVFDAAITPVEKKKIAPNQTTTGPYRHNRVFQVVPVRTINRGLYAIVRNPALVVRPLGGTVVNKYLQEEVGR
jgi:hypothetical protein